MLMLVIRLVLHKLFFSKLYNIVNFIMIKLKGLLDYNPLINKLFNFCDYMIIDIIILVTKIFF